MKKIIYVFFILLSINTTAQTYVNIPDPIFRNVLDSLVPGCISGTNLNTSDPGLMSIMNMDITGMGITDITGVAYLPSLIFLNGNYNQIFSIPQLPSSLTGLALGHNSLSSWPSLPSTLNLLKVDHNQINSISSIPPNIDNLDISGCNLNSIPSLPPTMIVLRCGENNLTSLPTLPPNLQILDCSTNHITSLPTLPNSLMQLTAFGNGMFCIPNLPTNPSFTSDIGYTICVPQGTPDTWFPQTALPNGSGTLELAGCFGIGNKCYVGGGSPTSQGSFFWEFNTTTNAWTQKANVPVQSRLQPVAFSIGNKGYFGMGQGTNPIVNNDIWEYNPVTNTWLQKASYPGSGYMGMSNFVVGDKAYVGCGIGLNYTFPTTFYRFDPVANTWTSIANFPGLGRRDAACFSIGLKGYVCAGDGANSLLATSYAYNVTTNTWTTIASTPNNLNEAVSFAINGKGYVATGQYTSWNGIMRNYLLQYDPVLNTWMNKADMPTQGRQRATGCAVKGRGYVGTGVISILGGGSTQTNDWWEYTPTCTAPSTQIYSPEGTGTCTGDSLLLIADPGNFYQWKRNGLTISGATIEAYYAKQSGVYSCVISNNCGSVNTVGITITINAPPVASITASGPTTFCAGGTVSLNANTGAGLTYQWKKYGNPIAGATTSSYATSAAGNYKVVVTNSGGCSKSSNSIVITVNPLPTATISANGPTSFCAGDSVKLSANSGTGLSYQWKKYSNNIGGATLVNYTAKQAGKYKCIVTNNNGCSKASNSITVSIPCREAETLSQLANETLLIYPNPASSALNLKFPEKTQFPVEYTILGLTGNKILESTISDYNYEITVSEFDAGSYILILNDGKEVKHVKFNVVH